MAISNDEVPIILDKFLKEKDSENIRFKRVKKALEICSDVYYNSGEDPLVSDEVFDKCVKKYESLTDEKIMGAAPTEGKKLVDTEHVFPELVGTLDKINSLPEFFDWIEKKIKDLKLLFVDNIELMVSNKEDGNSVTGIFNPDGTSLKWLSRGKDGLGLDLTSLFRNVKVPLHFSDIFGIKFEAVMEDSVLEEYSEASGKTYSNSRSAVAGILSAKDGKKYIKYVQLVPLRLKCKNEDEQPARNKEVEFLKKLTLKENNPRKKFLPMRYEIFSIYKAKNDFYIKNKNIDLREFMEEIYTREDKRRNEVGERPCDGIVIEFTNSKYRNKLGRSDDRNKFDVALKFPYQVKESTVKDIRFDIGKTGRITPVVIFKKLIFNGAICENVSIANYKRFNELKLCKGTEVLIEYRNDVLCYLQRKNQNIKQDNKGKTEIPFIDSCPICGSDIELNENETFAYCSNPNCPSKNLGKLVNWITKLDIKGINEKTIEALVYGNLINNIDDLYNLNAEDIAKLSGFQEKSAKNIVAAFNKKKDIMDYELLGSLNIDGFGIETAKIVCKRYGFSNLLKNMVQVEDRKKMKSDLSKIKNIGEKTSEKIILGLKENWKLIKRLLKILSVHESSIRDQNGEEFKIVFSHFRSSDLEKLIEQHGWSVTTSVSKKTSLLLVKKTSDIDENTSKIAKAKEFNIPIMTVDEFMNKMLNKE